MLPKPFGRGIVQADVVNAHVIFGALAGAIVWQIVTLRLGIPSSSSHALIGGLVGAGIAKAGYPCGGLVRRRQDRRSHLSVAGARLVACAAADADRVVDIRALRRPTASTNLFRRIQFVSASCYALGHGGNDAQKTMGIIAVLLYSQGMLGSTFYVPFWVVIACQIAMAAGTMAGGWRIVKTMGSKITRLTPMQGSCAETAGSVMLFTATYLGIPVSTTHTITGSIIGVGAAKKVSAVRWVVAREIVTAWIITIPAIRPARRAILLVDRTGLR